VHTEFPIEDKFLRGFVQIGAHFCAAKSKQSFFSLRGINHINTFINTIIYIVSYNKTSMRAMGRPESFYHLPCQCREVHL